MIWQMLRLKEVLRNGTH